MEWDVVAFTVRYNQPRKDEIEHTLKWLQKCGVFSTDLLLVIEDPCADIGSGGSTLNALLILAEQLCSSRGYTVLTEDVLRGARILILHSGPSSTEFPQGPAFASQGSLRQLENGNFVAEMPIVQLFENVNCLARGHDPLTWVLGTEAYWKLDKNWAALKPDALSNHHITAFTLQADDELARRHGVYDCDQHNFVIDIHFRDPPLRSFHMLCLSAICIPPAISTALLSLHTTYPISSSTYYGLDTGAIGFKLSLFFDFILAGCSSLEQFLAMPIVEGKCDTHPDLVKMARRMVHQKLGGYRTRVEFLPIAVFHYFGDDGRTKQNYLDYCCKPENMGMDFIDLFAHRFEELLRQANQIDAEVPSFHAYLSPMAKAGLKWSSRCLDVFKKFAIESDLKYVSRVLTLCATYLSLLAEGKGGVRSGPAANSEFIPALEMLKNPNKQTEGLEKLFEVTTGWIDEKTRMIRAARHLEAAAQVFATRRIKEICMPMIPILSSAVKKPEFKKVTVSACARVDLYGGWLDTPPITLDIAKSAVVNMAITVDGKKPLHASVERLSDISGLIVEISGEEQLTFASVESIFESHDKPNRPGSLICACLVATGLFDNPKPLSDILQTHYGIPTTGLKIMCKSELPHGSGLGTSSILAGALLAAIWSSLGVEYTLDHINHTVLYIEQLLTTGGGWQDSIGGLSPGLKITHFQTEATDGKHFLTKTIELPEKLRSEMQNRFALVYTGKTRLAKNLLQEVIRSWETHDGEAVEAIRTMQRNVDLTADKLAEG
ncbi:unnamed protein product, partial [Mesorhabditis spiculigera]